MLQVVQFSISSPDEIRNHSVVEVTKFETYEKDVPVIKGLFDIRMGVTDRDVVCSTCNQKNTCCPGHFGHIELARPVYNYHFIQTVLKVLKCCCYKCSKLLIDRESEVSKLLYRKSNKVRWTEVYNLCSKIKTCGQEPWMDVVPFNPRIINWMVSWVSLLTGRKQNY